MRDNCIRAFETAGDVWRQVDPEWVRVFAATFRGRLDEAESTIRDAVRRGERVGHQYSVWACRLGEAWLYTARGELDTASRCARDMVALAGPSNVAGSS